MNWFRPGLDPAAAAAPAERDRARRLAVVPDAGGQIDKPGRSKIRRS